MTELLQPRPPLDLCANGRRRDRTAAGCAPGQSGVTLAENISQQVEPVVVARSRLSPGQARKGTASEIAVLATGGFGRRELALLRPGLALLCAKSPDGGWRNWLALWFPCGMPRWTPDMRAFGFRCLGLPATDLAAATALLDARFLTGDEPSRTFLVELADPRGQGLA